MEAIAKQLLNSSPKPFEKTLTIQPRAGYSYKTTIESRQKQPQQSTHDIGCKVYINICYSDNLPAPKLASEGDIQKALLAAPGATYQVPLSLGQPRKLAGTKESAKDMIFDACIHTQPFIRSEHDLDFRLYLLELAMEHIEEALCVSLSRQFIMLKVAAKGAPIPKRTIHLPESSGSVDSLISRKLEVKKSPPPPIAPIVPQVTVKSWSCKPLFKKDNRTLAVIFQMPPPTVKRKKKVLSCHGYVADFF
jgi:hypothetical protein